jgi:hypothetical protein
MNENKIPKNICSYNKIMQFVFSSHNYKYSDTLDILNMFDSYNEKFKEIFLSFDKNFYFYLTFFNKRNKICYFLRKKIMKINELEDLNNLYRDEILENDKLDENFKNNFIKEVEIEQINLNYILENLMVTDMIVLDTNFYLEARRNTIKNFCDEKQIFDILEFKTKISIAKVDYDLYYFLIDLNTISEKKFNKKYFKNKIIKKDKLLKLFKNELIIIK